MEVPGIIICYDFCTKLEGKVLWFRLFGLILHSWRFMILAFYEAVDDWCKVQPDESNGVVLGKAAWVLNTVSDINSHLDVRLEEIRNDVIRND